MQKRTKSMTGRRVTGRRQATGRGGMRAQGRRGGSRASAAQRTQPRSKLRVQARGAQARRVKRSPGRLAAKKTTDHEFIRKWVEERGGTPSTVVRTSSKGQPGILRIDFPGFSGKGTLKPITWEEWFDQFEERQLAFLYQDKTANGKQSRFSKLVSR